MKTNKKFIVSSLATVMAVSMVGAITGTVAWYQYSTRATVSMIGMNVAETGMLEISKDGTNWQRDLIASDLTFKGGRTNTTVTPMTFGATADMTATSALPEVVQVGDYYKTTDNSKYSQWDGAKWVVTDAEPGSGTSKGTVANAAALPAIGAYKNPDVSNKVVNSDGSDYATRGSYATAWDGASAKNDYIQYDMYLRARTVANDADGFEVTSEKVFITDYVLDDVDAGLIADGLRVHLHIQNINDGYDSNGDDDYVDEGEYAPDSDAAVNYLFANKEYGLDANGNGDYTDLGDIAPINLRGHLDQDNDGIADRVGGYAWAEHRDDVIVYGAAGDYTQKTASFDSKLATRDSANNYAISQTDIDAGKQLFTTHAGEGWYTKITVTIWLEGWDTSVGTKSVDYIRYQAVSPKPAADANVEGKYAVDANGNYTLLGTGAVADGTSDYFTLENDSIDVADWSGYNTDGESFRFGLTFDVGRDSFKD